MELVDEALDEIGELLGIFVPEGVRWSCSTTTRARMPCVRALSETRALSSGVFGPVDFLALRRLASILAWDGISKFLLVVFSV